MKVLANVELILKYSDSPFQGIVKVSHKKR
jgi:hypothetical protein